MQLQKKTKKRYIPIYLDDEDKVVNYFKKGETISFKSLKTTEKFLAEQPEKVKGYQEEILVNRVVLEGLPKGKKYSLVDNDKK
jgi:hypothetical protein